MFFQDIQRDGRENARTICKIAPEYFNDYIANVSSNRHRWGIEYRSVQVCIGDEPEHEILRESHEQ